MQLSVTIHACEKSRTAFICLFIQLFFSFCWRVKRKWMAVDAQWWFLKAFSAHIREYWSWIVGKRQESKWFRLSKVLSLPSKGFFSFRYNYYCFMNLRVHTRYLSPETNWQQFWVFFFLLETHLRSSLGYVQLANLTTYKSVLDYAVMKTLIK